MLLKNHLLLFLLFLLLSEKSIAQFQSIQIGVNGLTCSQCSRSVEMSIRKLAFVKDVRMNLEKTEAEILLTEGGTIDIAQIAKAVVDAGFSVRYLNAKIYFKQVPLSENYCWIFESKHYQFIKTVSKELNGIASVTFIGEKFMSKSEYKKWSASIKEAQGKGCEAQQIYFIKVD
jgi:copper chaperone CopZ